MGDISLSAGQNGAAGGSKKHILINAFDMSTVGHLSPGQWKVRLMTYSPITKLVALLLSYNIW